jgi:hypothetical protein
VDVLRPGGAHDDGAQEEVYLVVERLGLMRPPATAGDAHPQRGAAAQGWGLPAEGPAHPGAPGNTKGTGNKPGRGGAGPTPAPTAVRCNGPSRGEGEQREERV